MGRSYSPAFLGWFSAMHYSFTWNDKSSSCTLSILDAVPVPQGARTLVGSKQFLCRTFLPLFIKQIFICLIENAYTMAGEER